MKKSILLLLAVFVVLFAACDDNDGDAGLTSYAGKADRRIKSITGENNVWGKYRLDFSYMEDGRLKEGWRTDAETGDTTGAVTVRYDVDYFILTVTDYVPGVDEKTAETLKEMYPDTYLDTLRARRQDMTLFSIELKDGEFTKKLYRPRRNVGSGSSYAVTYVHVADYIQIPDPDITGEPSVIRCYDDVYGSGGDNNARERTLSKYEMVRTNGEITGVVRYLPDFYVAGTWKKADELFLSHYNGVLTGVESDTYKMRHGAGKAVVAEPGRTQTYTLGSDGLATKMETSDGETAAFEYEAGSGNFYEVFTLPLERLLGKVWIR